MGPSRPSLDADERGTASMEMLLTLPTVFLFLVLLVDLGYGWVIKIKAEAATRFAGTVYIRAERGVDGRVAAWKALDEHYSALEIRNQRIASRKRPAGPNTVGGPPGSVWSSITGRLSSRLPRLSSSRSVSLVVERDPPVGTIFTASPVAAVFVIDKNPWNYDRTPLSLKSLLDRATEIKSYGNEASGILPGTVLTALQAVAFLVGLPLKFLFWIWGMYP